MQPEINVWAYDILRAIDEIELFVPLNIEFENFRDDLKTLRAVERNIEIVGEAMSRIKKVNADFPLEETASIIATRNKIIHGYDSVSEKLLWSIIKVDLPKLKADLEILMPKGE